MISNVIKNTPDHGRLTPSGGTGREGGSEGGRQRFSKKVVDTEVVENTRIVRRKGSEWEKVRK